MAQEKQSRDGGEDLPPQRVPTKYEAPDTRLHAWSGTTDDVHRLARELARLLDESNDPEIISSLSITVERVGRTDRYPDVDQFVEGVADEQAPIRELAIYGQSGPQLGPDSVRAHVYFWPRSGVIATASGTDRTRVNGIAMAVGQELQKGRRRGSFVRTPLLAGVVTGLTLALPILGVAQAAVHHRTAAYICLAGAAVAALMLATGAAVSWLIPRVDLRLPSQPTRWRRLTGNVAIRTAAGIASASIAAAIGILLAKVL